jgi:serine/threonine protein kinase, bacterial
MQSIDEHPVEFLTRRGQVFRTFDRSQDSGNVSYGVQIGDERFFVKTAGGPDTPTEAAKGPLLELHERVALLRNAVDLATSIRHPALAGYLHTIESPIGPMLFYRWAEGDLVGVPRDRRDDPDSAYRRFANLPAVELLTAFDQLIGLHHALGGAGWVAQDLYDGCLIYDFAARRLTVVDLDTYSRGPVINTMGRMFGASRFMSPEEFTLGAVVDERTTVFTLGRLVWHFGTHLSERADEFAGTRELRDVVSRACDPDRDRRPATIADFTEQWQSARRDG